AAQAGERGLLRRSEAGSGEGAGVEDGSVADAPGQAAGVRVRSLPVAQWAKILHVTPSAVYKQLAKREVKPRSTSGPQSRGKMLVSENRIRIAFPGRLQAKVGENRILTELFEKLDS